MNFYYKLFYYYSYSSLHILYGDKLLYQSVKEKWLTLFFTPSILYIPNACPIHVTKSGKNIG